MPKRCRGDDSIKAPPAWWSSATEWIRSSGGVVHPCLTLSENRELVIGTSLPRNEVLLEIPTECLISQEMVESTAAGKRYASAIESSAFKFHNAKQDLLIAMCLASRQDPEVSAKLGHYLETLPPSSAYDMLPRRWNDSDLRCLLSGSYLIERVKRSRDGAKNDYEQIAKSRDPNDETFPSFEDFDDMLAAVTSRAFAGMGGSHDQDIAMIPVLDFCNHHRGNVTKNVSYTKTASGVRVVTSEDLGAETVLAITYGARGNAQLLFNYGFCIPNNLEPDGSSNDVFEFKPKEELPPVDLRTGLKAYTFGGFVKALELFHPAQADQKPRQEGMDDLDTCEDGMEAFLDEWEEEEEDWEDEDGDDEEGDDTISEEQAIKAELTALAAMQDAFETAKESYLFNGDDLERALAASDASPRHYAAILVASELRAIYLYELGIQLVLEKLTKKMETSIITCKVHLKGGDEDRVKMQAKELAQAFMTIRYPNLCIT